MAHDNTEQLAGFDGIHRDLLMHELDELIKITDLRDTEAHAAVPWAVIEVFVNDFIAMSQAASWCRHLTRAILHGIDEVFPPSHVTGHTGEKQPI